MDLGLPDGDGLTVIQSVRSWSPVPVIVLSARTMEEQKIAALDAGADDYITKPFSAAELLARVRAALRRNVRANDQAPLLVFGPVTVDLHRREASGPDGPVHLTPLEFRVLECVARHSGMIVMQSQLIREVWGPGHLGIHAVCVSASRICAPSSSRCQAPPLSGHRGGTGVSPAAGLSREFLQFQQQKLPQWRPAGESIPLRSSGPQPYPTLARPAQSDRRPHTGTWLPYTTPRHE
ncbi:MAG: response regulator [Steroidobacteraceae bacterium]